MIIESKFQEAILCAVYVQIYSPKALSYPLFAYVLPAGMIEIYHVLA